MIDNIINLKSVTRGLETFKSGQLPFDHCVIQNFFNLDVANQLSDEFMSYNDPAWHFYDNLIENKKTCNNWDKFPPLTYRAFSELNSDTFIQLISNFFGKKLYPDVGLHGGGWHCHGTGGLLNPHLDYSIHPKLGFQRTLNIIIYLSKELKEEHGGHLGLWSHDSKKNQPDKLVKEIKPVFNQAIIFDTTQNSWHGMSRALTQPEGIYRKSMAVYYLKEPDVDASTRGRALFAPTDVQKENQEVAELIKLRSNVATSTQVYRTK